MKKMMGCFLALAMIGMSLSGCSQSGGQAATTTAAQSKEAAADTQAGADTAVTEGAEAADGDYGFPDTTITWMVPGKAGGGSDLAIRYLAESMTRNLGITTTVSNYDSNTVGHQTLANASNDGSNVMLATAALSIQYIMGAAELDPVNDLTMIACLQDNGYSALAVPANAPYDDFSGFVEYAKAHPGELNAGQSSSGNNRFQFGMIMNECGIELNPVECASESDRLTNLAGGFIDIGFVGVGNAREYEQAGKLKVIGTMADVNRVIAEFDDTLPANYQTLQEQGFENCYWGVHHYVMGPKDMDPAQVEKMNAALKTVIEDSACNDGIAGLGQVPEWHDVAESKEIFDAEYSRMVSVAEALGIYAR